MRRLCPIRFIASIVDVEGGGRVRILCFLGGISFCGLGYQIFTKGGWWSVYDGIFIDYHDVKTPVGISMIVVGLFLVIYSIIGKWQKLESFICPNCEKCVTPTTGNEDIKCPMCNAKMGYRHKAGHFYST